MAARTVVFPAHQDAAVEQITGEQHLVNLPTSGIVAVGPTHLIVNRIADWVGVAQTQSAVEVRVGQYRSWLGVPRGAVWLEQDAVEIEGIFHTSQESESRFGLCHGYAGSALEVASARQIVSGGVFRKNGVLLADFAIVDFGDAKLGHKPAVRNDKAEIYGSVLVKHDAAVAEGISLGIWRNTEDS